MKSAIFLTIFSVTVFTHQTMAFSVGVYNIWHGLTGQGTISIGELEEKEVREQRESEQNEYLGQLSNDVDILFLQEVNPVSSRSRKIAKMMEKSFVQGVDNCGLKIFRIGLPTNMYSGLTILANPEYKLKKLGTHTLSGSKFLAPPLLCVQFSERRAALFASAEIPNYGKVLLVNLHLHHNRGASDFYNQYLKDKRDGNLLTADEYELLTSLAKKATQRRLEELTRLISLIEEYKAELGTDKVIVGGDFNMDFHRNPSNLRDFEKSTGLKFPVESIPENYYSWSPTENSNVEYVIDFLEVYMLKVIEDEAEGGKNITKQMLTVTLEEEKQSRLIDLVYFSENFFNNGLPVFNPIGVEKGPSGRHYSDHFGYSVTFE